MILLIINISLRFVHKVKNVSHKMQIYIIQEQFECVQFDVNNVKSTSFYHLLKLLVELSESVL